jgi:DUF3011 family protein
MKTCLQFIVALCAIALAGCVAYPAGGYGADSGNYPGGYPANGYPEGYPGGYPPASGYPGNYPPNGGYGAVVRCESTDNNTRHCDMDTRAGVSLSRRLSDSACIQGRTWGYDGRGVWVTRGCRAEFVQGGGGYGNGNGSGYGAGRVVRCESQDGRSRHCNAPVQRGAQLLRTLSDSACIQGSTWGWDRSGVWVDRGCRAEFSVY